jgi:hypothetical protein
MRVKGVYRNQTLELALPVPFLEEGTEVEVDIRAPGETAEEEDEAWRECGMSRMEEEWDNPEDAIYDDWRKLYGG